MIRRLRSLVLPLFMAAWPWAALADTVALLVTESRGAVTEFVTAFERDIRKQVAGVQVRTFSLDEIDQATGSDVKLLVAVGTTAQLKVAGRPGRPPVLAVLSPRQTTDRIFAKATQFSALYLDQPEDRQMALVGLLPGKVQGVGLIYGSPDSVSVARYRQAAKLRQMRLVEVPLTTSRDVAMAAQEAVAQSEVLLAHPDPAVFNGQTIQSVLLTTYRARVPVLGFSPAYTRAGALLSLHSSAAQLSEQAVDMARLMLLGKSLSAEYPRQFEVTVNAQVARSLGIELGSEQDLAQALRAQERAP